MKKKKPSKSPKRFNPPGVFRHDSLTKEDAKHLFDRLWEIAEVTEMCNRLSRLTGCDHQWSFSTRRGADADEPLYQVWAVVGPRTTGGLRMVEHVVSGPFKAVVHYTLGVSVFLKAEADRRSVPNDRPLPKTKRKKVKDLAALLLAPEPARPGEPKFLLDQKIKSDGHSRTIIKILRHGSHSYKYQMDDGSIWTQAELTAVTAPK